MRHVVFGRLRMSVSAREPARCAEQGRALHNVLETKRDAAIYIVFWLRKLANVSVQNSL